MKGKNKEIIIAHPLDKLWMLPKQFIEKKKLCTEIIKKFKEQWLIFNLERSKYVESGVCADGLQHEVKQE